VPVEADLARIEGVEKLYAATKGCPVDALLANAGIDLGGGFLDQNFNDVIRVIDTNVTGTLYLIQRIGRDMRERNSRRILITGSIAGLRGVPFRRSITVRRPSSTRSHSLCAMSFRVLMSPSLASCLAPPRRSSSIGPDYRTRKSAKRTKTILLMSLKLASRR
jgi:NAD(P)-dependent dehydrogenase (short-subunit alcohol dehydrogenase family)